MDQVLTEIAGAKGTGYRLHQRFVEIVVLLRNSHASPPGAFDAELVLTLARVPRLLPIRKPNLAEHVRIMFVYSKSIISVNRRYSNRCVLAVN